MKKVFTLTVCVFLLSCTPTEDKKQNIQLANHTEAESHKEIEKMPPPKYFHVQINLEEEYKYSIELVEEYKILYQELNNQGKVIHQQIFTPSLEDWHTFYKRLDTIGVCKWKSEYTTKDIHVSKRYLWNLKLDSPLCNIGSQGNDTYPSQNSTPNKEQPYYKSEDFGKFLLTIQVVLLDGKRFF